MRARALARWLAFCIGSVEKLWWCVQEVIFNAKQGAVITVITSDDDGRLEGAGTPTGVRDNDGDVGSAQNSTLVNCTVASGENSIKKKRRFFFWEDSQEDLERKRERERVPGVEGDTRFQRRFGGGGHTDKDDVEIAMKHHGCVFVISVEGERHDCPRAYILGINNKCTHTHTH